MDWRFTQQLLSLPPHPHADIAWWTDKDISISLLLRLRFCIELWVDPPRDIKHDWLLSRG
jgi:hypothetical protein